MARSRGNSLSSTCAHRTVRRQRPPPSLRDDPCPLSTLSSRIRTDCAALEDETSGVPEVPERLVRALSSTCAHRTVRRQRPPPSLRDDPCPLNSELSASAQIALHETSGVPEVPERLVRA